MGLLCRANSSIAVRKSIEERPPASKGCDLQNFKTKELEAATRGFAKENFIAKVSHGEIYMGTLADGRVVTVKRPTPGPRIGHDEDVLENEMQILSKLFSRRLVNLLGYSQDAGRVKLLVLEHMSNGTLHDLIQGADQSLSWPMRVRIALHAAKAIRALHASSPPIVHRNIKSSNVFIDKYWNARLGDFGLARCVLQQDIPEPPRRSNLLSIPEIESEEIAARFSVSLEENDVGAVISNVSSAHYSTKTDVFNFGMLMLEIMSGRNSVLSKDGGAECTAPFRLRDWALPLIKQGNVMAICDPRLQIPQATEALTYMATIASRCVRSVGSRRPSMEEVVQGLSRVCKLIPLPMWTGMAGGITLTPNPKLPETSGQKSLIASTDDSNQHTFRNTTGRFIRLPVWTGLICLKKKRAFVYGLNKFFARKFRINILRYSKLSSKTSVTSAIDEPARRKAPKGPLKGSRVCDEELRQSTDARKNHHHVRHKSKETVRKHAQTSCRQDVPPSAIPVSNLRHYKWAHHND